MNTISPATTASAPARSRSREWLGLVLVIALPAGVLITGAALINHYINRDWDEATATADRELAEAIADADRLDPGWRLDELTARRKVFADEDNAAVRVVAAKELLGTTWPRILMHSNLPTIDDILRDLPSECQLNDEQLERLSQDLRDVDAALAEARRLADQPEGRHPLTFQPDYISTLLLTQHYTRDITKLLRIDAVLLAQECKVDDALASIRSIINAGRSLGDEPMFVSQLIRLWCRNEALTGLERVLAQGEPSEEALAAVQRVLVEEDSFPLLLVGVRGERAGFHMLMENLELNKVTTEKVLPALLAQRSDRTAKEPEIALDASSLKSGHVWLLRWMNEAVEIAKLPAWQREPRLKQLEQSTKGEPPPLARLVLPSVRMVADADQRSQAMVRCALAAVAAERYRRAHGFWPRALADLEGKQLAKVPLDPYDGQPLRYRPPPLLGFSQSPKDVVIYSIGPDGEDNGGKLNRALPTQTGIDIGFRLWNVRDRRQPPAP